MFAFVGASFEHATKMALHINYARCTRWFQLQEFHLKSNKMYELNYWKKSITHKKTQSKRSQLIKFMYWAHFIPVKEIIRIYACGFCLFQQFHSLVYFGFFVDIGIYFAPEHIWLSLGQWNILSFVCLLRIFNCELTHKSLTGR